MKIFDMETNNLPFIKSKIMFDDSINLSKYTKDDFFIYSNSNLTSPISFEIKSNPTELFKSYLFIIDMSGSMQSKQNMIVNSMKKILEFLKFKKNEVAISGFNSLAYINHDLTENIDDLMQFSNKLDFKGNASLDAAIYQEFSGASEILANSKYKKEIILLTDGLADYDYNQIQNALNSNNITLNIISLEEKIDNKLKKLATNSNGLVFDELILPNQIIESIYSIMDQHNKGKIATIEWQQDFCLNQYEIVIKDKKNNFSDTSYFNSNNLDFLEKVEFDPKNEIDFGLVNSQTTRIFKIKPLNSSIKVKKIISSSNLFSVFKLSIDDIISKNEIKNVEIKFNPLDTNFTSAYIDFEFEPCLKYRLNLFAGSRYQSSNNSSLIFENPILDEQIISGTDYLVKWNGMSKNDFGVLEYSKDKNKWSVLSSNVKNGSFLWKVPDISESINFLKISQSSLSPVLDNVKYINSENNITIKSKWSYDGKVLITGTLDGEVLVWDYNSSSYFTIQSGTDKIFDIQAHPSKSKFLLSYKSSLIGSDIILWDYNDIQNPIKIKGSTTKIHGLAWSATGDTIIGGTEDGTIYFWKNNEFNSPFFSQKYHKDLIHALAMNPKNSLILSGSEDGMLKLIDPVTNLILDSTYFNKSIKTIEWSKDGLSFLVDYNDSSFACLQVININGIFKIQTKFKNSFENLKLQNPLVQNICFDYSGNYIFSVVENKVVIFNSIKGDSIYTFEGHKDNLYSVAVSVLGNCASSGEDKFIEIWKFSDYPFVNKPLTSSISSSFSIQKPILKFSKLDFMDYCVNFQKDSTFKNAIQNLNQTNIKIDSVKIIGDANNEFSIMNNFPQVVEKNKSFNLSLNFHPLKTGNRSAYLELYIGANKLLAELKGFGIKPNIEQISNFINFKKVNVGEFKDSSFNVLINNDNSNLQIVKYELLQDTSSFKLDSGFNNLEISANSKHRVRVKFNPKSIGKTNAILRFHTLKFCTPIDVALYGEATAPIFSSSDTIELDDIKCMEKTIYPYKIYNKGNGILKISNYTSFNDQTFELENLPYFREIPPYDSLIFPISIIPFQAKLNELNIKFNTNMNFDGTFNKNLYLKVRTDSSNFILETNNKIYSTINTNAIFYDSVKISNFSDKITNFTLTNTHPLIKLNSNQISIHNKNGEKFLNYQFLGSDQEAEIIDTIKITSECNITQNLILYISVNNNKPLITISDTTNLGDVFCESNNLYFYIYNYSKSTLKIDSIFTENNPNLIIDKSTNLLLKVNDSLKVNINYTKNSSSNGIKNFKINIKSNAINSNNGLNSTIVVFNLQDKIFEFSKDTVDFGEVETNRISTKLFNIKYNGNLNFIWPNSPVKFENYTILEMKPSSIKKGENAIFTVSFETNINDTTIISNFDFIDDCAKSNKIFFKAISSKQSIGSIYLDTLKANSGDVKSLIWKQNIPDKSKIDGIDSIQFLLKYNPKVMLSKDFEPDYYSLELASKLFTFSTEQIKNIENVKNNFYIAIGDSQISQIFIDSLKVFSKENKKIDVIGSYIKVMDVCTNSGNRLFDYNGRMFISNNFPNPFKEFTSFEMNLIENGIYSMDIYNLWGLKEKEVFKNKFYKSGSYSIELNLSNLLSGIYFCILQTPSEVLVRKITKIE